MAWWYVHDVLVIAWMVICSPTSCMHGPSMFGVQNEYSLFITEGRSRSVDLHASPW